MEVESLKALPDDLSREVSEYMVEKKAFLNCIILLMGFAGSGKRTIAEAISKKTNFKFVPNDCWMVPVLSLLGNDGSVMWDLTAEGWKKLNEARDVIFTTISDVCPKTSSFVMTSEMIDQDPYHKIIYDKIVEIVEKRQALFLPVRLVCDEEELVNRVQIEDRKQYFKTTDAELIRRRFREKQVFHSGHKNEFTINNTDKTAEQVAAVIISQVIKLSSGLS